MGKRTVKMSELTAVRFTADMMEEIELYRAEQRPIPPKGVAIRDLVGIGIETYKQRKERKKQIK